jgi:hypothetical protein
VQKSENRLSQVRIVNDPRMPEIYSAMTECSALRGTNSSIVGIHIAKSLKCKVRYAVNKIFSLFIVVS